MTSSVMKLYELAGEDPELRFSPHCWKIRLALAHKGLEAERIPWRFTEKEVIAFSGQALVPVLVHDDVSVSDSWRIALHLEERFPQRPSLFGSPHAFALARFVNAWADRTLTPALTRIILVDIYRCLHEKDRDYFRQSREQRFAMPLENLVADRRQRLAEFRNTCLPLRQLLGEQNFICGEAPAYADYCVFGMFMWARCTSRVDLVEPDDPIAVWQERLLGQFDGLAKAARTVRD